jgi:hypothetical protein
MATAAPEAARPENPDAPLRWLTLPEAHAATSEPNLRHALTQMALLLAG